MLRPSFGPRTAEQAHTCVNQFWVAGVEQLEAACSTVGMVEVVAIEGDETVALRHGNGLIARAGDPMVVVIQPVIFDPSILKRVYYFSKVARVAVVIYHDGFPIFKALRKAAP